MYAAYAWSYYFTMFMPYALTHYCAVHSTLPVTLVLSNLPGLRSPLVIQGKKTIKSTGYFIPGGHSGIGIAALSYLDYFTISCTTDDSIMKSPKEIVLFIEDAIEECVKESLKESNQDEAEEMPAVDR